MKILYFIFLSLLLPITVSGQIKEGIVNYSVTHSFSIDSTKLSNANIAINRSFDKLNELEFELAFNGNESIFKYSKFLTLDKSDLSEQMAVKLIGNGQYYLNIDRKKKLVSKNFIGDQFLINYPFATPDWKISSESKMIGDFKCLKATLLKKANEIQTKDVNVIAWFALEIPTHFGPKNYFGLPGLILELTEGKITFKANNINFNDTVKIEEPKQGIELTETEFNNYIVEKSREMGFIRD